jgi:hypothetical protein
MRNASEKTPERNARETDHSESQGLKKTPKEYSTPKAVEVMQTEAPVTNHP